MIATVQCRAIAAKKRYARGRKTTYRSADLDKVLAHRSSVVHGVERSDLVHSHGRHLKKTSDLVHDANAGESVLALAEVEQRHDGSLLVLGRVPLEDLGNDGLVLLVELEGDVGVVVLGISMLSYGQRSDKLVLIARNCAPIDLP